MQNTEDVEVTQRFPEVFDRELTHGIIQCGMRVHSELGPGLLESVYEEGLCHELHSSRIQFRRQVESPIRYKGTLLATGLRIDLLIEEKVIVEVKSVERLIRTHDLQLLTYLKLTGKRLGLLMNFNEAHLRDGIRRKIL